jgi:putative transposase
MADTIRSIPIKRPRPSRYRRQNICLDAGYQGEWIWTWLVSKGFTPHVRGRGEEWIDIRKKGFKPRRWVVEQTFGCINRDRSILIRWSKDPENYEAVVHVAAGILCFSRASKK